jgi:hypothetical protein
MQPRVSECSPGQVSVYDFARFEYDNGGMATEHKTLTASLLESLTFYDPMKVRFEELAEEWRKDTVNADGRWFLEEQGGFFHAYCKRNTANQMADGCEAKIGEFIHAMGQHRMKLLKDHVAELNRVITLHSSDPKVAPPPFDPKNGE